MIVKVGMKFHQGGGTMRFLHTTIMGALAVLLITGLWTVPTPGAFASDDKPGDRKRLDDQIKQEEKVRHETDLAVRRVATMLSVLEFYGLESDDRKKMLEEVGNTLNKLHSKQMAEVIDRLNAAAAADNSALSEKETFEAFKKHTEVMIELRRIMAAFDTLKSLEDAANELDTLAVRQQKNLQLSKQVAAAEEEKAANKNARAVTKTELERPFTDQTFLNQDVEILINRIVRKLKPKLPTDQQERVKRFERQVANWQVAQNLGEIASTLDTLKTPASARNNAQQARKSEWEAAHELQSKSAVDLQKLATILRTPTINNVNALNQAILKLDEVIAKQEKMTNETQAQQEKLEQDPSKLSPNADKILTPDNQKKVDAIKAANPTMPELAANLARDPARAQNDQAGPKGKGQDHAARTGQGAVEPRNRHRQHPHHGRAHRQGRGQRAGQGRKRDASLPRTLSTRSSRRPPSPRRKRPPKS